MMTTAIPFQKQPDVTAVAADFRAYLEHSLRDPFTLNLKDCSLMEDIGFDDPIRIVDRREGKLVVENIPKWRLISSHTARRTAITINILRGQNVHAIKRCSGHTDLRIFDNYVRDE